MAFTTTATQAEFRAAWDACIKMDTMLQQYAQGDANKDKTGRFSEAAVTAQITATVAALNAITA